MSPCSFLLAPLGSAALTAPSPPALELLLLPLPICSPGSGCCFGGCTKGLCVLAPPCSLLPSAGDAAAGPKQCCFYLSQTSPAPWLGCDRPSAAIHQYPRPFKNSFLTAASLWPCCLFIHPTQSSCWVSTQPKLLPSAFYRVPLPSALNAPSAPPLHSLLLSAACAVFLDFFLHRLRQ